MTSGLTGSMFSVLFAPKSLAYRLEKGVPAGTSPVRLERGIAMTIDERDYMRSDGGRPLRFPDLTPRKPWWRRALRSWKAALPTALLVIAVASAALWFLRDAWTILGPSGPSEGSLVVNINTATAEEVETIPGIGPARAQQIIASRPYGSIDELVRVQGISESNLREYRPFVTVTGDTFRRAE